MTCSSIRSNRVSVYVIHSHDHNVSMYLMLRGSSESSSHLRGTWHMISGRVKEGEKSYQAALRAVREQTGLVPSRFYHADAVETFYSKTTDEIMTVPVFVAFLDSRDVQVELSLTEHDNYEWVAFDVAQDRLLFNEQKRVLLLIRSNFIENDPNPIHLIDF